MSAQDITDRAGLSVTLVRRILRAPAQGPTARDIARTSADAILGIPLPARHNPGTPGLTDSTEAPRLLADLARAGSPSTTLAKRLPRPGRLRHPPHRHRPHPCRSHPTHHSDSRPIRATSTACDHAVAFRSL